MDSVPHAWIARRAASAPDALALVEGPRQVTYRELDRSANRLAHLLRARGVQPGDRVAVRLPRGVNLVVGLLGVWRAGAAYAPLDPSHPAERTATVLADARPRLVISDSATDVVLDPELTVLRDQDDTAPDVPLTGDHPAYVLYTSGSTGTPKGVVVTLAGIGNQLRWLSRTHALEAGDRVLQKTALTFDAAGWEIWAPLVSGATVVLAPPGAERDAGAVVRAIADHGITVLQVVPSVLRALVEEPGWERCTTLRVLSSGGEQLHADLVQRFLRVAENCPVTVWNTYGPTEAAIDVTAQRFDDLQRSGPVPIGAPIDGMRVELADDGELLIAGPGVAQGYLGSPALTAERFVPGEDGGRWYRSGDRARRRADGTLEYLGRIDQQVKVDGVRIEPGEVEAVLSTHPAVRQAVVVPYTAANGTTRLAAHVRTDAGADLAAFLATRLPETHVPAAFIEVGDFPRTSSGKVDRAALPAPGVSGPAVTTEAQELVAGVWRELLGVERVGAHDDFFRLGGSSLQLTRLGNRLRAATGVDVPLAALLSSTTVAAQARLIDPRPASAVPVRPVPRDRALPLSFGQQRLWLLDRIHPAAREWVSGLFLRTDAGETAVRAALDSLVARHESLRTRFVVEHDEPRQVVDPPRPVDLRVLDVPADRIAAVLDEDARRGFDLATGPVVRALLFPAAGRLVVLMHHIVCDGWSSAVLEREFHEVLAGRTPSTPDVQYADFAVWQRERLTEDVLERELAHWREELAGAAPLALRTDHPRPAARDARGAVVGFTVPAAVARELAELGRRSDATPFMVLLTAYATLLARYTAQWDVVVGSPVAGRDRPEVEDVVGFFLNSLVLRCRLDGDMTFEQALDSVRDTCKQAFAHQELPFERLVAALAPERDLSRTPLYQVAFDFHGGELTGAPADDAELATLLEASQVAKTDLTLYLREQADGSITGMFEYATSLFDHSTVERLAGHFGQLLATVTGGTPLGTADLMPAAELRDVLSWSANPVEPVTSSVLDGFERRAATTPDATALVVPGGTVTFRELDAHANRLARKLRDAGVGPESVVGVWLDRSADLPAAFLAVWKAGGAYVPLDPDFPADRVRYVLADVGADVLITRRDGFDGLRPDVHDGDATPLPRTTDLDALAYVIYTSGSTGRPKGVQVPHRGLANHVRWAVGELAGTGGAPVFSSVAFDLVVPNVWAPLLAGHPTHLLPQDLDLSELGAHLLAAAPYGFLKLTPGHLDVLTQQLTPEQRGSLADVVVVAGEALPPRLAAQWDGLVNEYGPTETSVGACTHPVRRPLGDAVPIGKPLPGVTMHVLDSRLRPVPVGVVGELFVGGAGVARGYAGRPDLTAERFLPDPFGPPGARFYRTGDLVRLLPGGDVDFVGRRDQQVKIRGYRVELGEIAAVIAEHPGVRDAVVVAPGGVLTAYYVPVAGDVELSDWCAERLPAYMVPATSTSLAAFPLTANGKLDRAALPPPGRAVETLVAPRGVVEERVAEIFTALLGVPAGAHSHFFSIGGNSILAIRLIATIQSEFEVTVPMRAVFEGGTVADLAAVVEQQVRAEIDLMSDEELALLDESENR